MTNTKGKKRSKLEYKPIHGVANLWNKNNTIFIKINAFKRWCIANYSKQVLDRSFFFFKNNTSE